MAEYGYDGLAVRVLDLDVEPSTRRILEASAVPLVSLDTSIQLARPFDRELPTALALAADWGAPLVRVFGGDSANLDDIARRLAPALDLARSLGVTVVLETHDAFSSAVLVGRLLDRVDDPAFAALWDVHHPYRVGESPETVLASLGARIRLVHVKDARADGSLVPLGEGDVPVYESLALLLASGYAGWLTVEWEKRWHPELAEPEIALPREVDTLERWLGVLEARQG